MGDEGGRVPGRAEATAGREAQQEDDKTAEGSFRSSGVWGDKDRQKDRQKRGWGGGRDDEDERRPPRM